MIDEREQRSEKMLEESLVIIVQRMVLVGYITDNPLFFPFALLPLLSFVVGQKLQDFPQIKEPQGAQSGRKGCSSG